MTEVINNINACKQRHDDQLFLDCYLGYNQMFLAVFLLLVCKTGQ